MADPSARKARTPEQMKLQPEAAVAEIVERANAVSAASGERVLIGIAGGPGVGKSTIAADVVKSLNIDNVGHAVVVPMDGFHMRQIKLKLLGLENVKGAPHTFEAEAFIDYLEALKTAKKPVMGPSYSRKIEDVVPNGFSVATKASILVVEGNYLLLDAAHWNRAREMLDMSIFIHVPRDLVRTRLLKRHAEHKLFTEERNIAHVDNVDLKNFDLVERSKNRANVVIDLLTDA